MKPILLREINTLTLEKSSEKDNDNYRYNQLLKQKDLNFFFIIKKTMCHSTLKERVCDRHLFLGCSEIKTPKQNPLTKVSGLISDIKQFI